MLNYNLQLQHRKSTWWCLGKPRWEWNMVWVNWPCQVWEIKLVVFRNSCLARGVLHFHSYILRPHIVTFSTLLSERGSNRLLFSLLARVYWLGHYQGQTRGQVASHFQAFHSHNLDIHLFLCFCIRSSPSNLSTLLWTWPNQQCLWRMEVCPLCI